MPSDTSDEAALVFDRLLLPLASEDDATRTAAALIEQFGDGGVRPTLTAVHVIEKGEGAIDKVPVSAQKEEAQRLFDTFEGQLAEAGFNVTRHTAYGGDIVDALIEAAADQEATAIVFLPRPGGTLSRLLGGDLSNRLIGESPVPVIALPQPD